MKSILFADLVRGVLLQRYKRFLIDAQLQDGSAVTASVANPGRMTGGDDGAAERGYAVPSQTAIYLQPVAPNYNVKHAYRWMFAVEPCTGALVGVYTMLANRAVREALEAREASLLHLLAERDPNGRRDTAVRPLRFDKLARECRYPTASRQRANGSTVSRCDFCLDGRVFIEVKSVTMLSSTPGLVMFPDAVSARAVRHLEELANVIRSGRKRPRDGAAASAHRAMVLFVVQRSDRPLAFCPAQRVDPLFAIAMRHAASHGVEFRCCWLPARVQEEREGRATVEVHWGRATEGGNADCAWHEVPVFLSMEEAQQYLQGERDPRR